MKGHTSYNLFLMFCHRENSYPVATSHIFIDLSRDADNTKSPAGTKATDETLWSWPSIVLKHSKVCVKSHNLIDMSALQDAKDIYLNKIFQFSSDYNIT